MRTIKVTGPAAHLGDGLHRLSSELSQVSIQRQLVVQDLIRLDLNICKQTDYSVCQPEQRLTVQALRTTPQGSACNQRSYCALQSLTPP